MKQLTKLKSIRISLGRFPKNAYKPNAQKQKNNYGRWSIEENKLYFLILILICSKKIMNKIYLRYFFFF